MKKYFALLIVAMLALGTVALAETPYTSDDITFTYDETVFQVSTDDRTDDETTVVLSDIDDALGGMYIRFYLHDLEDGETLPTLEEIAEMPDVEATQGEWNGYKDVITYTVSNEDGTTQTFFLVPVADEEDGEIDAQLTVEISISEIEDEEAAMGRDDLISAVLDTLVIDD